jgi:hypothetical protein
MTATVETENSVRSADGTMIAFERSGAGPALIVVDAAGSYRDFRPLRAPVERLAADFTVYAHDCRGRGVSTDTSEFAGLVAAGRRRDAGGILPPRDRRAGGGHGADGPAGLGGAGGGRAHPRLRLQDLRRDVASAHQVGACQVG